MTDVSELDVSVFDPFAANPVELREWLARRNLTDGDDLMTDIVVPLSGFVDPASTVTLLERLSLLPEQALSIRLQRAYRTGRNRLGTYRCDVVTALDQAMFWNSLAVRSLVVVLLCTAATLLGLGSGSIGLLLVLAWSLTVWRGRFAFPLTVAVLGIVAWSNTADLLYFAFAAGFCGLVRLFLWFVRFGLIQVRIVDSPARFLGRAYLTRALWDRNASSVLLAITKATHEEKARAPFFIDDVFDRAPAALRPVLVQCQALVAIGRLEFSEALRLSEEARTLAASAPEAIRGWCALQSGDVLLAAGQPGAAERRWAESVELLADSRRAAFWLMRAELRLIEAQTTDLDDPERCLLGLRTLYDVRRRAVRRGDLILLRKTENYLLRLMHQAGNTVGVVVQLHADHEVTQGGVELGDAIADRVGETLLLASLYLDIVEHPELYPDDVEVDTSDPERYDFSAELADNALRHLSRSTEPLLEAQAYAILARVRAETGQREEALGNALASLNVVQRVRYQLPTAQWRTHWLALHAHTYALALELAESDGELVAELLETVRAQAIPLETGTSGALLRAAFDSLLTATGLPMPAGLAENAEPVRADPLQTDRTILVSGASWVGGDDQDTIELERELDAMFPRGWYWSLATVGEWVYHAVRSPTGTWFTERRPYGELEPSFSALLSYLPVEQADGADHDEALGASSADQLLPDGSAGELLSRLFEDLGDALIPLPLRHAAHGELLQIVVAPTASLAVIPIAALSLGEGRHLLDVGYVAHLPSVALLAARRSRLTVAEVTSEPAEVLTVLAPDTAPETTELKFAVLDPPLSERTLTGPLQKGDLAAALAESKTDSVLYLAGHVEAVDPEDPGSSGFMFADGAFGLRDLYQTTDAGAPRYPVPEQVVLAGCRSIGLYFDAQPGLVDAPEWLGLGAAMVYGGARHVFCTLYDIPDTAHTPRIDRALVDSMRFRVEPARALRAIQRAELDRWFDGRGSTPLVFLAYAYVGLGHAAADADAPEYGTF